MATNGKRPGARGGEKRADSRGRQQPAMKAAPPTKARALAGVSPLSQWWRASEQQRAKFIDDVGLLNIYHYATPAQRAILLRQIRHNLVKDGHTVDEVEAAAQRVADAVGESGRAP